MVEKYFVRQAYLKKLFEFNLITRLHNFKTSLSLFKINCVCLLSQDK